MERRAFPLSGEKRLSGGSEGGGAPPPGLPGICRRCYLRIRSWKSVSDFSGAMPSPPAQESGRPVPGSLLTISEEPMTEPGFELDPSSFPFRRIS